MERSVHVWKRCRGTAATVRDLWLTAAGPVQQEIPHDCKDLVQLVLAENTLLLLLAPTWLARFTGGEQLKTSAERQHLRSVQRSIGAGNTECQRKS